MPLKFFKRKRGKGDKNASSSPKQSPKLQRHISLPLIDAGTQADLSPRTLKPNQSLLDYSASVPNDLSDIEPGYSTVHDAITHVRQSKKQRRSSSDELSAAELRPLPPIPKEDEDQLSSAAAQHSHSDSTFTSLTPEEYGSEAFSGSEPDDKSRATVTPLYSKVNKDKKNRQRKDKKVLDSSNNNNNDNDIRSTEKGKKMERMSKTVVVKEPAAVCELENELQHKPPPPTIDKGNRTVRIQLDYEEESSDSAVLLGLVGDGGAATPKPSSPVSLPVSYPVHRPPPSPNPSRKPTPKTSSNERPRTSKRLRSPSSRENRTPESSSKAHHSPRSASGIDLSNIPVYNLNQSSADGYILSRSDPDGTVEYFTATPIFSPSPSPFFHQSASLAGNNVPGVAGSYNISTDSPVAKSPIQFQFPVAIPQTPIPQTPQAIEPQPFISVPVQQLQTSVPIQPHTHDPAPPQTFSKPQSHNSILPQSSSKPQSYNTIPPKSSSKPQSHNPISFQRHIANTSKHLSSSQPLLNTFYIKGLSEIDQVLSEHEERVKKHKRSPSLTDIRAEGVAEHSQKRLSLPPTITGDNGVVFMGPIANQTMPFMRVSSMKQSQNDEMKKDASESLKNSALTNDEETPATPQQIVTAEDSVVGITAEQLVTETPIKLKRVLDKLLAENAEKDKRIESLQDSLTHSKNEVQELSVKIMLLDKSNEELLKSASAEKQALYERLSQIHKENEELNDRLKASMRQLKSVRKEHDKKVDRLKEELQSMRSEVVQFQTSVHTIGHQCTDLEGIVSVYDSHTHIPLEEHRRTVAKLERLIQQMMQKSSSNSFHKSIELTRMRQENQMLVTQLTDMQGSLSVMNEECKLLRRQKRENEETISLLNKDLRYSQARETQALKSLNESFKDTEESEMEKNSLAKMTKVHAAELREDLSLLEASEREMDSRRKNEHKMTTRHTPTAERSKHHLVTNKKRARVKINELESELVRKERMLSEMSRDKRIAERQRDLLWQSRTRTS